MESRPKKKSRFSDAPESANEASIPSPSIPNPSQIAEMIARKKKEIENTLGKAKPLGTSLGGKEEVGLSSSSETKPSLSQMELARKIQEAKERIRSNASKNADVLKVSAAELLSGTREKGGLRVKAHPSLVIDEKTGQLNIQKGLLPKFATVKANQRVVEKITKQEFKIERPKIGEFINTRKNPFYDPRFGNDSAAPKNKRSKRLKFSRQGKYIEQANQLRAKVQLEKLKAGIAETVKKAGMQSELDLVPEKGVKSEPPPTVEWWDAPFLPSKTYDYLDEDIPSIMEGSESITSYVQHPVPIAPPSSHKTVPLKPLMLTKKERKKLRRQRRLELQREKQDKIRLGLLPPDAPKVKLSNLMRVFGNEAIQDPSKMEAQVRKQMDKRALDHIRHNEMNKLTDEQRREKKRKKLEEDTTGSVHVAVFRIDDLSHPQRKFKVDMNAQQLNLTGVAVLNPLQNLVIVEGGPKGIKAYKKLLLRRIDWSNAALPNVIASGNNLANSNKSPSSSVNECLLIWEGIQASRSFKQFRFRLCQDEKEAKESLSKYKSEHLWELAKQSGKERELD